MKYFYDYDSQLNQLLKLGLEIPNLDEGKNILKKEGYFNLVERYGSYFMIGDDFSKNITINQLSALVEFDRKLRGFVFVPLSIAEDHIKNVLSYEFSRKYGYDEKRFLTKSSFTTDKRLQRAVDEVIEEWNWKLRRALDKDNYTYRDFVDEIKRENGIIPLAVLTRIMSFGDISEFYAVLREEDKNNVSQVFGVDGKSFVSMLKILVRFRNVVAHGDKLFSYKTSDCITQKLPLFNNLSLPCDDYGNLLYGKRDFLALLIIFKYILSQSEYSQLIRAIEIEIARLSTLLPPRIVGVIKTEMGLKGAWRKLPNLRK